MDPAVVVLIVVAVLLIIGGIIAVTIAIISSNASNSNQGMTGMTGTAGTPCNQVINIDTLLQIPDANICIQQGQPTPLYYIGDLGDRSLDYVVAPWPTSPIDVCVDFCSQYSSGSCTGPSFNGVSAQDNFDNCMMQLSTDQCQPPIPLAARGTTLYYAQSPTCRSCDNCAQT
jgi:hypothetical protein